MSRLFSGSAWFALLVGAVTAAADAEAQEYSRFVSCTGSFAADGKTSEANVDLALRFNSRTALIQSSNVLPVGEALRYVPTPANYSMTYLLPPNSTQVLVVPGWFQNTILVAYPNLKRVKQIRLSIDRQTGLLNGKMLNQDDEVLATLAMTCRSQSEEEIGAPKF